MRAQLDVLREVFEEWLRIHQLDYDYGIYTREQWQARGESVITDAQLVIAFDNQLVSILNWTGPWDVEEELQDLASGFGYYFEMGHHWNIGFYPLDDWPPLPPSNAPYSERLKDDRWKQKRKRIVSRSKGRCEECGQSNRAIEVHHCYYRFGREPWQYPDGAFLGLCASCHKTRADAELRFRLFAPTIRTDQLLLLRQLLRHSQYWFDRVSFDDFIMTLARVPGPTPLVPMETLEPKQEGYKERRRDAEFQILCQKLYQMLCGAGHPDERRDNRPRQSL